jgi:hypothetical protein
MHSVWVIFSASYSMTMLMLMMTTTPNNRLVMGFPQAWDYVKKLLSKELLFE